MIREKEAEIARLDGKLKSAQEKHAVLIAELDTSLGLRYKLELQLRQLQRAV